MYDDQTLALAALAAAVLGFLIGAFTNRKGGGADTAQTEQKLAEVKREQAEFQEKVDAHFTKTGELLGQMADNYREVHKHLAEGAQELGGAEFSPVLALSEEAEEETTEKLENIQQPKDYAPRSPDEKGALHEEFGMEKKVAEEEAAQPEVKITA